MAALRGTRDYIYRKYTIHRHGLLGLVCLLLLCLPGLAEIATSEEVKALRSQTHWRSTRFYTAVALLGLPYYMYAYIWNFPVHWNLIFKGHGVEALSFLCFPVSKIVQAATFLWWSTFDANVAPQELLAEVQHMSSARMLLCLSLCIAGQTLNAGVYRAIGHDGVYYGCKLGRKIPWTTTFPYNLGIRSGGVRCEHHAVRWWSTVRGATRAYWFLHV